MPHGKLEVYVEGAVDIQDSSILGKGSPYCTLTTGSQERSTPPVPEGGTRPCFNTKFEFQVDRTTEQLTVEIFSNLKKLRDDDLLGQCRIVFKDVFYHSHVVPVKSYALTRTNGQPGGHIRLSLTFKAIPKSVVPYRPPAPPPSIAQEQPLSTVIQKALLVNRPTRLLGPRGRGRSPLPSMRFMTEEDSSSDDDYYASRRHDISEVPQRRCGPPSSMRFMTEEDSSSDDDNASGPHEIGQYHQPRRRPSLPPGVPRRRRPTPLSPIAPMPNTNINSLLQTFGGASMHNVGGALPFHDGDGADSGGGDDKEVSTTSYGSAPEEYVENYDEAVGYEDPECCDDIYAIANNSSCQARESTSDVEKKSTHADHT